MKTTKTTKTMQTTGPYHHGELAVQARAGVQAQAKRVGRIIAPTIPPPMRTFLADQVLAIVGSVAADGAVWASPLVGAPGFLRATDEQTLHVAATPVHGDPLADNLHAGRPLGLLVIDLATRRRVRLNGTVDPRPAEGFDLHTAEVFGNCQQYIQRREIAAAVAPTATAQATVSDTLTADQQRAITSADTFFIASYAGEGNADASHRGGNPGFVYVVDDTTLVFPDYAGNNMFQTLGNITTNPQVGLLFLDFARGDTLQLTGSATINWDAGRAAAFPGAHRLIEVRIARVVASAGALPLRWRFIAYSAFNPG